MVEPLITHRFPIEKATEAYEVITGKKKEPFLGVLLTYPDRPKTENSRLQFHASPNLQPSTCNLGVLGAGLFANATLLPAIVK